MLSALFRKLNKNRTTSEILLTVRHFTVTAGRARAPPWREDLSFLPRKAEATHAVRGPGSIGHLAASVGLRLQRVIYQSVFPSMECAMAASVRD